VKTSSLQDHPFMSSTETPGSAPALPLAEGQVVTGAIFGEPMRVETVRSNGSEEELYREVTALVKSQSHRAEASGDDARSRAIRFLMAMYQRRLASSTYALRRSLENRIKRLTDKLQEAQKIALTAPPDYLTLSDLRRTFREPLQTKETE
jgi:hypothetical protein